jgi:hypothetical protein
MRRKETNSRVDEIYNRGEQLIIHCLKLHRRINFILIKFSK